MNCPDRLSYFCCVLALLLILRAALPAAAAPHSPGASDKPTLYLLAIGISQYQETALPLRYATKDVTDVVSALQGQQGRLFRRVIATTLTDRNADRVSIAKDLAQLGRLRPQMRPTDYVIVFLAGRGTEEAPAGYLFEPYDFDHNNAEATGVDWSQFTRVLGDLPGRVILIIDTAHAASAGRGSSFAVMASCGRDEMSEGSAAWGHGAFTQALLQALQGQADGDHNGRVTVAELAGFVSKRVAGLTQGRQHPVFSSLASLPADLPLAAVK